MCRRPWPKGITFCKLFLLIHMNCEHFNLYNWNLQINVYFYVVFFVALYMYREPSQKIQWKSRFNFLKFSRLPWISRLLIFSIETYFCVNRLSMLNRFLLNTVTNYMQFHYLCSSSFVNKLYKCSFTSKLFEFCKIFPILLQRLKNW